MRSCHLALAVAALAIALSFPALGQAEQIQICNWLSNFDVVNRTGIPVTDFKITLFGVTPADIQSTWSNARYGSPTIVPAPDNTMIVYERSGQSTPPGATEHFGVNLSGNPIRSQDRISYTWTLGGVPVLTGGDPNMPQQIWNPIGMTTRDVIRNLTLREPRPLDVQRRFAVVDRSLDLADLLVDGPLFRAATVIDTQPFRLSPDQDLTFDFPAFDPRLPKQGLLMAYIVTDPLTGERVGTMLNAVNIAPVPEPSSILLLALGGSGLVLMMRKRGCQRIC